MGAERKELQQEITAAADYIATLIRRLGATTPLIENSQWTIGTAAAHLVISLKLSRQILQGDPNPYSNAKPETVAAVNTALLREFTERRGDKLATMLIMHTEKFLKETENYPTEYIIKTHFGSMDMLTCLSYNLSHLLIHGTQIARALKKPLPVQEKHVRMVLPFLKQAMLVTYDTEAARNTRAVYAFHLKNIHYAVICDHDTITITEDLPAHIDCHIKAEPTVFFLVATGVIMQWKPLLQGKIFIWGRKPWLALRLQTLFRSP